MPTRRSAGYTLIELMIVVAIIGVLMAVGLPAFNDLIKNNRRTTVVNEIVSYLMTARAEAVKRGQPVTVCGNTTSGGTSCTGGTNWDYGFMVFFDGGPPPAGAVAADGAIADLSHLLRKYVNDYPDIRVRTSIVSGSATGHITLQPFNQAGISARILVCDSRGIAKARRICVGTNGRSNVSEVACDETDNMACP